jgi:hypothetical protein
MVAVVVQVAVGDSVQQQAVLPHKVIAAVQRVMGTQVAFIQTLLHQVMHLQAAVAALALSVVRQLPQVIMVRQVEQVKTLGLLGQLQHRQV